MIIYKLTSKILMEIFVLILNSPLLFYINLAMNPPFKNEELNNEDKQVLLACPKLFNPTRYLRQLSLSFCAVFGPLEARGEVLY